MGRDGRGRDKGGRVGGLEERERRNREKKNLTFCNEGILVAVPHSWLNFHLQNLLLQDIPA